VQAVVAVETVGSNKPKKSKKSKADHPLDFPLEDALFVRKPRDLQAVSSCYS
jgi:hypothetical protein